MWVAGRQMGGSVGVGQGPSPRGKVIKQGP